MTQPSPEVERWTRITNRVFFGCFGVAVLLLVIFVTWLVVGSKSGPSDGPYGYAAVHQDPISLASFRQIQPGMSRQQVENMLGIGKISSEMNTESGLYTNEVWYGGGGYLAVEFHNRIVDHAFQSGLQ